MPVVCRSGQGVLPHGIPEDAVWSTDSTREWTVHTCAPWSQPGTVNDAKAEPACRGGETEPCQPVCRGVDCRCRAKPAGALGRPSRPSRLSLPGPGAVPHCNPADGVDPGWPDASVLNSGTEKSPTTPTGMVAVSRSTVLSPVPCGRRVQCDATVPRTVETVMLTPLGPSVGETSGLIVTAACPGRAGETPPRDRCCHSPTPPHRKM